MIENFLNWLDSLKHYDAISLIISVAGFLISIGGSIAAFLQARKSKQAAQAAETAALDASTKLRLFTTAIDFSKLGANWQTVIQAVRTNHYETASLRCGDVREMLAHARADELTGKLIAATKWQALLSDVATMQRTIEAFINRAPSPEARLGCIDSALEVSERLNAVVGKTKSLAQEKTVKRASS